MREKQITEEAPVTTSIAKETPSRMSCTSPNMSNTAKSDTVTIKDLLQGRSAEHQYKILMKADQILLSEHRFNARMQGSLNDYHVAPGGDGPLAGEWKDKPHRLLYDLLGEIQALREKLGILTPLGRFYGGPLTPAEITLLMDSIKEHNHGKQGEGRKVREAGQVPDQG